MNAEIFAEWLRRRGRLVLRTASSYWHSEGVRALQAFPYHWIIHPRREELTQLLRLKTAISLRYSTSADAAQGYISYHGVLEKCPYEIENLGKWARKNVRRGLRNCAIEPLTFPELAEKGWDLHCDTLRRQGRSRTLTRKDWNTLCLSAADLPGFEAWGALVQRKLAASVITFLMDDCCYLLYQQCRRESLPAHVNNALGFTVTQTMLRREAVNSVFYGLHSLDAPPSVDEFKFRIGFTAKPVRQRVVFHPAFSPFVNRFTHALLRAARALHARNSLLAKTEGMVRFYLHGKETVPEQMRRASCPWLESASDSPHGTR